MPKITVAEGVTDVNKPETLPENYLVDEAPEAEPATVPKTEAKPSDIPAKRKYTRKS